MSELAAKLQDGNDFLESLLGNYAPQGETFDVTLPKGEVLKFKAFSSYSEVASFKRDAADFARQIEATGKAKGHPFFVHYIPKTAEEALVAYSIHALSVEPKFEIPQAFALLKAPWLAEHIMDQIDRHRMAYLTKDGDPVQEAKKD